MTVSELASATGIPVGKLWVFMRNYILLHYYTVSKFMLWVWLGFVYFYSV